DAVRAGGDPGGDPGRHRQRRQCGDKSAHHALWTPPRAHWLLLREKRLAGVRLRLRCCRWKGRAGMTNSDSTDMVPVTIIGVAVAAGPHSERSERFSIVLASA